MTLISLPYRTQLAAGQPEDIGMVLADMDAILAVVNGDLRNDNFNAAAAIAASKLAGYPTDATKYLSGVGTWTVPSLGASPGFTVVTDTLLGADAATIDIQSIASGAVLLWHLYARSTQAAVQTSLSAIRYNNDAGATQYDSVQAIFKGNTAVANPASSTGSTSLLGGTIPAATATAGQFGAIEGFIPNYAGTANRKEFSAMNGYTPVNPPAATDLYMELLEGQWRTNSTAINRITYIILTSGNYLAGTRLTMVKA